MEIVIEYVLLENFLINLIVLKTVALVLGVRGRLFPLSAFLGACLTVVTPLLGLTSVGNLLCQIGLLMVEICISFRFSKFKRFCLIFACHFAVACLYGGACFFFEGLFGISSLLIVLAVVIVAFLILRFVLKKCRRKKYIDNFCFDVELEDKGRLSKWKAFLDSGNLLFDPVTQSPVTLISFKVFSALFEEIGLEDVLRKSDKVRGLRFAHYIAFSTLNANDKILVFQVDRLRVGKKVLEKPTLGLCFKNFNDAFGSDIILHNNFASFGEGI
ncbi:MAG: sigma-E processing peptidase SpoIIGA [Clostridia bacterium]|nr:sigma-E processing peptidase SpoIIGA [Clostridia bacterium]